MAKRASMMPDEQDLNPFEKHINSESFDMSKLEEASHIAHMGIDVEQFLKQLPQPLNYEIWDTKLDMQQKSISAHLITELAEKTLRELHGEELKDFSHDDLIFMLTIPVTVAMLAERELHKTTAAALPEVVEDSPQSVYAHPSEYPHEPPRVNMPIDFEAVRTTLARWYHQAKERVLRFIDTLNTPK